MKKLLLTSFLLSGLLVAMPSIVLAEGAKTCDCEGCGNKDKHTCTDGTCDCEGCDCHKS